MKDRFFNGLFFYSPMEDYKNQENIIRSKQVLEVFAVGTEYCRFIDGIRNYTVDDALLFLQSILPALYLKGTFLPTIEVQDDSADERFVTEEEYETLRLQLAQFFGERDFFSAVDLTNDDIESMPISLSELLADIYMDMKDFLLLYAKENPSAKENAVAACHYYFHTGWGNRLVLALPQIHRLVAASLRTENNEE